MDQLTFILQNSYQHKIADMLWDAPDFETVQDILKTHGYDAEVVYNMMIAAALDQVTETDLAKKMIQDLS